MSWQEVTYRHIQCDGRTTRGQCDAVLSDLDRPVHIRNTRGGPARTQTLFSGPSSDPLPAGIEFELDVRWLVLPDKALCPDHVAAEEHLLAAELDGLPFDEQDGGDSRG